MINFKPGCENCDKDLPVASTEAMICAFECTFCRDCVTDVLHNVCPNCGGGFEKRPVLVGKFLAKYPPSTTRVLKPVNLEKFEPLLDQFKDVPAENR